MRTTAPEVEAPQAGEPASSLDRTARSAEALHDAPDSELRRATVQALLDLAHAIEGQASSEAAEIREYARRLDRTELQPAPDARDLATARDGLMATWRALSQSATTATRSQEYEQALATLRAAAEALGSLADAPAEERRASVASAFRAASDALSLSQGSEPVFAESENAVRDAEVTPHALLEEARAEILKLGQTRWVNAPLAASRALQALSELIAARAEGRLSKQIGEIRYQAESLRRPGTSKFGSAGWIKSALMSSLDALEVLEAGHEQRITPWTRSARRAVSGIIDRDSLSFQRAAVQDALRATVDAFMVSMLAAEAPP